MISISIFSFILFLLWPAWLYLFIILISTLSGLLFKNKYDTYYNELNKYKQKKD